MYFFEILATFSLILKSKLLYLPPPIKIYVLQLYLKIHLDKKKMWNFNLYSLNESIKPTRIDLLKLSNIFKSHIKYFVLQLEKKISLGRHKHACKKNQWNRR